MTLDTRVKTTRRVVYVALAPQWRLPSTPNLRKDEDRVKKAARREAKKERRRNRDREAKDKRDGGNGGSERAALVH